MTAPARETKRIKDLEDALRELISSVEIKASGLANPARYFSPRMEEAIDRAKKLLGEESRSAT